MCFLRPNNVWFHAWTENNFRASIYNALVLLFLGHFLIPVHLCHPLSTAPWQQEGTKY